MARRSPAERLSRILTAIRAWERHARRSTLGGTSLSQFKTALQPSVDAHARVAALRKDLRIALIERDTADRRSFELIERLSFAVKGDPRHGFDSDLLEDLGYTRAAVRRSRIRAGRARKR